MNEHLTLLSQHLEQETQWIEKLNILLQKEKTCLEHRQFKTLEELAQEKQELSTLIENSSQKRLQTVQNFGCTLQEYLANYSLEEQQLINSLNKELAGKLAICQELNTINGQVIANNLYVHQEIAHTLSGNGHQAMNVYNAYGNVKISPNGNHHQKA